MKDKKTLLSDPWLFKKEVLTAKKGSKLTYKERMLLQQAKEFNKQLLNSKKLSLKEIDSSRKDFIKLLSQTSSLTAALIKKGMQL